VDCCASTTVAIWVYTTIRGINVRKSRLDNRRILTILDGS
jgi:hypothetical protein